MNIETPNSWTFAARILCDVLEREHSSYEDRKAAREDIMRMAQALDAEIQRMAKALDDSEIRRGGGKDGH
jgi:fructose/tagatose bisphosphate aldolase